MKQEHRANVGVTIETKAVLRLENNAISFAEAVELLRAKGNDIIETDEKARTITVADSVDHPVDEVWVCDHCGAYSKSEAITLAHEAKCNGR